MDVTRRTQLDAALAGSAVPGSLRLLTSGIAHDLGNLLMVIDLHLEALSDGPRSPALAEAAAAIDTARNLVTDLISFARAGNEVGIAEIDAILESTRPWLERLAGEQVELTVKPCAAGRTIRVDRSQFQSVLLELATNACQSMPEGGHLLVSTHPVGEDLVRLTVSDDGAGMSPETGDRAFDPLFTTRPGQAVGLGLSSIRSIVERCGGTIEVESALGEGARFYICLPAKGARSELVGSAALPTGRLVLLVEDEERICTLLADALRRNGYEVLATTSAREAKALFLEYEEKIELVISDVLMPECSGDLLIAAWKERRPSLEYLFVSAMLPQGIPVHRYLQKPFRVRALLDKVTEILG